MYTMDMVQNAMDRIEKDPVGYADRAIYRLKNRLTSEERWFFYGFYRVVSDRMGGNAHALRICKAIEEMNS